MAGGVERFKSPEVCQGYVAGQDKVCPRCEHVWSIDDKEPPRCLSQFEANQLVLKRLRMRLSI